MTILSEFNVLERISVNANSRLYRAERSIDKQKVIVKILEGDILSIDEIVRFSYEHEIATRLSALAGVPEYLKLESYSNKIVAVLTDFGGIPLEKYISENKPTVEISLGIAISITKILETFCQQGIVIQSLCTQNVFINPQSLQVKLMDFSFCSRLSKQTHDVLHQHFPKSSLPYISPEQTGRMQHAIDFRSDLYSLGVILYELFTGNKPFESKDVLELIHCHIAKNPIPPHIIKPAVPVLISKIILKLLAKNAEDRYQSPFGLCHDLEICQLPGNNTQWIEAAELGKRDFSGRLQVPKKLYGRASETTLLAQALERVCSGTVEYLLIEGLSGIGKSTLVQQLQDTTQIRGGIFLSGKFNQFQNNVPYSVFIPIFKELIDFILTQSIGEIQLWKDRILEALGANGKVLTDIIPQLELLIGRQPSAAELEPNEAQNRLYYVFRNFIKCIASKEHPLVIFFDDLQWADAASMNLFQIIATDKSLQHFLFIGAQRLEELTLNSVVSATLEELQRNGMSLQKIFLEPLSYKYVEELIQETLATTVQNIQSLVELVHDKSQGNPFFINTYLKCLYAEDILAFDFYTSQWVWDADKLHNLKFTDTIVELMVGRIQKLPTSTQEILKLAACIGFGFNTQILKTVLHNSVQEVNEKLKPALDENLILPFEDNYRFTHDRIQQAAYSLIHAAEKKQEHFRIGSLLLQRMDTEAVNKYLFEIVNQLNSGIDFIEDQADRYRLVELNFRAGIKAKNAAAYMPSFEYFRAGIDLLLSTAWKDHYELSLQLYTEGAESAFLSGNTSKMEEWVESVLQYGSTVLDKVRVYEIRIKSYTAQHRLLEAVHTSLQVLKLLNVCFPKNPTKLHVLSALLQIEIAFTGKSVENLIHLPSMRDPYVEAAVRVLASVGSAVYFALPDLFPLFVCKAFHLMIKYGNTPYSGVVCASFGLLTIAGVGKINTGYKLGKVALQLAEKINDSSFKYQSIMMVNSFITHWKEPTKNILEPLRKNYWSCLETGNTEFASYSAMVYCYSAFFCGRNLKEVIAEMMKFKDVIEQLRQESALTLHKIHTQAALNLYTHTPQKNPTVLTGEVHDEAAMLPFYQNTKAETALFDLYLFKLILSYLFEKYDEAEYCALEAGHRLESTAGSPTVIVFYLYDSLTQISLIENRGGDSKRSLLEKLSSNLKKVRKFAQYAPSNTTNKLLLIEAELCRVTGKSEKAGILYDQSIIKAKESEYINEAALALELAGKFYIGQNREFIGQQYLLQAYQLYQDWGAFAKVRDMEQKYPYLCKEQFLKSNIDDFSTSDQNDRLSGEGFYTDRSSALLDLSSIMKAAAAISSEIQLDKLLKKLITIAVENAGAQKGYLILKKDSEFFIEAESSIDHDEPIVIQSVPIKGNKSIPEAIVQFVYLTQNNLVIGNAAQHSNFASDPIIAMRQSKSILCLPINHQGDVIGLLYFENSLITNAFAQDRIELLNLLSGQMAVSIQNALNEHRKTLAFLERERLLKKINLQQKIISKAILNTQENERKRIAEELHDGLGYLLSTLKLNLTSLEETSNADEQGKLLQRSLILLEDSFKELRYISNNLMPDILFQFGLLIAVNDLCSKVNETGRLKVNFRYFQMKKLRKEFELEVFRIVQELINNTIKHANAQQLDIQFLLQEEMLTITVEDDGKGFDYHETIKSKKKGKGLKNINNRANFLGGTLYVEALPGKGATFILTLPLTNKTIKQLRYGKTFNS